MSKANQKEGGAGTTGGEPAPSAPPHARLLREWSVEVREEQWFVAPERQSKHLVGYVDGRDNRIITSRIVKTEGRLVTTRSGSVYELGAPSADYLEWLAGHGMTLDEAQPVKVPG